MAEPRPITLYRGRRDTPILERAQVPHPGLLFERFPRLLTSDRNGYDLPAGRREGWLGSFIKQAGEKNKRLERHHARMDAVVQAMKGEQRLFRTRWRLALGLGNPNAADIGFALDHATGAPVVSGSAVKGLTLAGARWLGEGNTARSLLGTGASPAEGQGSSGTIAFLDALPASWPPAGKMDGFQIDVITRHHDAEALQHQVVPLDSDEPVPVHFLTVGDGVDFVFRLIPLRPGVDLAAAWRWLTTALSELGAGGKTAVGYGEMRPVTEAR